MPSRMKIVLKTSEKCSNHYWVKHNEYTSLNWALLWIVITQNNSCFNRQEFLPLYIMANPAWLWWLQGYKTPRVLASLGMCFDWRGQDITLILLFVIATCFSTGAQGASHGSIPGCTHDFCLHPTNQILLQWPHDSKGDWEAQLLYWILI